MNGTFSSMKENYEAAAAELLARRDMLRGMLKKDTPRKFFSHPSMQKEILKRRIDLLTAEYYELRAAIRSIEPYVLQEVQV